MSAGLEHLPGVAPWGRLTQPHCWCPQAGDMSSNWVHLPFPNAVSQLEVQPRLLPAPGLSILLFLLSSIESLNHRTIKVGKPL